MSGRRLSVSKVLRSKKYSTAGNRVVRLLHHVSGDTAYLTSIYLLSAFVLPLGSEGPPRTRNELLPLK
ncbi:hypothetical protein PHLCEN_2v7093 [Hermanssonia centrifuga]|uniref:Uncharacterized protein n=1 Tax=Hermanssonia centrifuga TaxID=98765 RepID=A0A2R6NXH6_9APHY|nr:hypothetical protein PHLCEN_2v7093 [Hermanssonia centrifuga]